MRWLDGAKKREKALQIVQEADEILSLAGELRARATVLSDQATHHLAPRQPSVSEDIIAPGWAMADEDTQLERDANLRELEYREMLRTALNYAPELPEAHERLTTFHQVNHKAAEQSRAPATASEWATLLLPA
ncbi:MAG: hypothetical protein ACJATT_004798 [Myxococcota bacterium]|jgi:hypothetical protein